MFRPFLTAFSGTAVEFFETIAIAYAILRAGYPREAISATVIGHVVVLIAAIFLWPFHDLVPVFWFRLAAASLLTLMGLYWTIKSIRRASIGKRPRWLPIHWGGWALNPSGQ